MPNPWLLNGRAATPVPQVFLVERRRPDGWVQVLLPERPNGSMGWVPAGDLRLSETPYRIEVSLSSHLIAVLDRAEVLYRGPVATGAPRTPTPPGSYSLRVLLQNPDPASVYGPYAYGLTAHSDALTTFSGGDAEIGLHGNDDASQLGQSVTHGCVRMDNAEIAVLAALLPLGTPVDISA